MKRSIICLFMLFLSNTSFAEVNRYISASVGASDAEQIKDSDNNAIDFDQSNTYQLVVNQFQRINREDAHLYYELFLSANTLQVETESDNGFDLKGYHLHLGGSYEWADWPKLRPYFSATLGGSVYSSDVSPSETFFSGSFGIGARYFLSSSLALKFEARALGTLFNGRPDVFCNRDDCSLGVGGDLWWQRHLTAGLSWSY